MGLFSKKEKKRYCLLCGRELTGETCQFCGREAKPLVPFSALNWQKVPAEAVNALCGMNNMSDTYELSTVKEIIEAGGLSIADIYVDKVFKYAHPDDDDSYDIIDDIFGSDDDSYGIQFSTPDLSPCDTECHISVADYRLVEELLKNGRHDAKILWGRKKKSDYYYAFMPQSDDAALLSESQIKYFINIGAYTQKRSLPPKGGEGNSLFDKVFDSILDKTIEKL